MAFSPGWLVLTWIGASWYFFLHPHIIFLSKMGNHFWFGQQMSCLRGKTGGLGQYDVDKDPATSQTYHLVFVKVLWRLGKVNKTTAHQNHILYLYICRHTHTHTHTAQEWPWKGYLFMRAETRRQTFLTSAGNMCISGDSKFDALCMSANDWNLLFAQVDFWGYK